MSLDAPGLDSRAVALLRSRLDVGETLLWAERPDSLRMTVSSTRAALSNPRILLMIALLSALLIWSASSVGAPREWDPASPFIFSGIFIIAAAAQLALCLLTITLFFTPVAYGATRGYLLICRGLIARRLLRTPVSLVTRVRLHRWAGSTAVVFDMVEGQTTSFSFLHAKQPAAAVDSLQPLVDASKVQS